MDLWIRSQNKEDLIKASHIYIQDDFIRVADKGNAIIGKYKTKERALEVLDTIQNILQPVIYTHEPEINYDDLASSITGQFVVQSSQKMEMELKQAGQFVYQMPEE